MQIIKLMWLYQEHVGNNEKLLFNFTWSYIKSYSADYAGHCNPDNYYIHIRKQVVV